jgi:ribosomal protein S18 acetylase RimI-like enzyme
VTVARWASYEPRERAQEGSAAPTLTAGVSIRPATLDDARAVAAISIAREGTGDVEEETKRVLAGLGRPDVLLLVAEALAGSHGPLRDEPKAETGAMAGTLDDAATTGSPAPIADAGRIVGFGRAGWIDPAGRRGFRNVPAGWYLLGVVVVDAWRRQGIGRELTRRRLAWIAERAPAAYFVANARNRPSLDLHAALGFVEVRRDLQWPGMKFEGGTGVLSRCDLGLPATPGAVP